MPRVAVMVPRTSRVALKEGDWVEFKDRLTTGEKKRLDGAGIAGVRNPGMATGERRDRQSFELDFERLALARFEAYVVAWSFLGLDNQPLPVNPDTIASLDPVISAELEDALDRHLEKQEKEKNAPVPVLESVKS